MKRILMLLALLMAVLLVCSSCQVSQEEWLTKLEDAATQGDFDTVWSILDKNEDAIANDAKLGEYYQARQAEYNGEAPGAAWAIYTVKTPGFMDSDERAKTLQEKIGARGYLFDISGVGTYSYYLYGDTLFTINGSYMKNQSRTPGTSTKMKIVEEPIIVKLEGRCALADPDGTLLTNFEWRELERRGDYYVGESAHSDATCILDAKAQVVATVPWGILEGFSGEDRVMRLKSGGKYGFVDFDGNVISEAAWTDARGFNGGYAAVKDEKWGFIDKSGKVVVETKFDEVTDAQHGYSIATMNKGKETYTNVIDMRGEVVNPYNWPHKKPSYVDGVAVVRSENDRCSLIDVMGNVLSSNWINIERSYHGVSVVKSKVDFLTKYGLINNVGQVILEPCMDDIDSFYEGYAYFRKDGDYGYLDAKGNIISEAQWDFAWWFENGYAKVEKNDVRGLINTRGELALPTAYDDVEYAGDDVALVSSGNKWGAVDMSTGIQVSCVYDKIYYLGEGLVKGLKVDSWGEKTFEIVRIATGENIGGSGWEKVSNAFDGMILAEKDKQNYLVDCQTGAVELMQPIKLQ